MTQPQTETSWRAALAQEPLPAVLLAASAGADRQRVAAALQRLGYAVTEVADATGVLEALQQKHHPVLLCDLPLDAEEAAMLARGLRTQSFGGHVYAIALVAQDSPGFAPHADDVLAKPVGKAIGEAELEARLLTARRLLALEAALRESRAAVERLAISDSLTATYNRRYLMQELPGEVERSRRFGRPLSVVMCDIDHLKQINETHGHQVGDEVLREFAQHLASGTRAGVDWCARYGGEEFVLVLPETDAEGAANLAEKLRAGMGHLLVRAPDGTRITFTASFGVAGGRRGTEAPDPPILIARADLALYQSKQEGRNRVSLRG